MAQENKKLYLQDISPIEGIYSDFVLLKNSELIVMIKVEGVNMDLLAEYEQNSLFEDYGAFLMSNNNESLQTVSMTVPLDLKRYNLYWKKRYLSIKNSKMENSESKKHLQQLIAANCMHYQDIELNSELTTQQHLVVLSQKIQKRTLVELSNAEKELREKMSKVKNSLESMLESHDVSLEILSTKETISTLHRFIDFKYSIYA
ncbi:hypothetical protein LGK95_09125 [Clostridium algoriphilum]|uniref:TrsD/TraD family conjugative transfer protein n=1 Tax=Clostridium algoriphilum TaxID=198347 RepID=UPI001CF41881|nr:TrsD/TraD family conjugative transfer protein [Clostridium algoriphilum]MCB2293685.1 hypothetical protein [Clostridium algoriphilum]